MVRLGKHREFENAFRVGTLMYIFFNIAGTGDSYGRSGQSGGRLLLHDEGR